MPSLSMKFKVKFLDDGYISALHWKARYWTTEWTSAFMIFFSFLLRVRNKCTEKVPGDLNWYYLKQVTGEQHIKEMLFGDEKASV